MNEKSDVKRIFVVRHGHAGFEEKNDFKRQLNRKGINAVQKTANFIQDKCKELSIVPELCISSAAIRTRQTTEIICKINNVSKCKFYKELYSAAVSTWLEKIKNEPLKNIIIVGHNPTFSQMINNLCGYELYIQPANCALISLEFKPDGIIYPATLTEFYQHE
ncbi:MAG: hypothetical protein JKX98_01105 [Alcanivoracaceae bacterium]|nr:hypothetical protein [Alcanivoracaceae bacterium]